MALTTYVEKFTNLRFKPAGMTDDQDIRMAQSIMDYIFRRLALDHLPYETRAAMGIFTTAERTVQLDASGYEAPAPGLDAVATSPVTPTEPTPAVESDAPTRSASASVDSTAELFEAQQGMTADAPLCLTCGVKMRPVAHSDYLGWSVFRHKDVVAAVTDHDTFSSTVPNHPAEPNGFDTSRHGRYRRMIDGYFTRDHMDEEIVSILRNWTVGELGTMSASVGILVAYLEEHQRLQNELRRNPGTVSEAVDEILRMHPPTGMRSSLAIRRAGTAAHDYASYPASGFRTLPIELA